MFSVCAQTLMHATVHRGYTNTVKESALKVEWEKSLDAAWHQICVGHTLDPMLK